MYVWWWWCVCVCVRMRVRVCVYVRACTYSAIKVLVEFTPEGRTQLNLTAPEYNKNVTIMYWQGPIVKDKDLPANVSRLAFFRTEIHSNLSNETRGEMVRRVDGALQCRLLLPLCTADCGR